jgi:hypothetical protein
MLVYEDFNELYKAKLLKRIDDFKDIVISFCLFLSDIDIHTERRIK